MMMWDDDVQLQGGEEESELQIFPNGGGDDQQDDGLIFSCEDLKKQYHMLKYLSIDWTTKNAPEVRKSTITNIKDFNKITIPNFGAAQTRMQTALFEEEESPMC